MWLLSNIAHCGAMSQVGTILTTAELTNEMAKMRSTIWTKCHVEKYAIAGKYIILIHQCTGPLLFNTDLKIGTVTTDVVLATTKAHAFVKSIG